jgi:uncharacterized membrane protein YeaQ/YmgE (transglycosylase-associated protein family)
LFRILARLPLVSRGNLARIVRATIKRHSHADHTRKETTMSALDVLSWIVVGLIVVSLVDAITPGRAAGPRSAVALTGIVAAVAGGSAAGDLSEMSAVAFLGAVCAAIVCSVSLAYLLRRSGAGRYHN